MRKSRLNFNTVTTYAKRVATAISGAALGVAVDRFTKGAAEVSTLSAAVIAAAVIAFIFAFEGQSSAISGLRELSLAEGAEQRRIIEDLKRHLGLKVSFQAVRDLNTFTDLSSDAIAQAMIGAKRELLVVDLLPPNGVRPDASMRPDLLQSQWEGIIRQVRDNPSLGYKRLCQVRASGNRLALPPLEATFAAHCREMLSLKEQVGARVSLRFAPMRYPYKFIIVDREILILELHRVEKDGSNPVVDQELIIKDTEGTAIEAFRSLWDDLSDRPETRAAAEADLA